MPHNTLPPIPARVLSDYRTKQKLNRYLTVRRMSETGQLERQTSQDPADDAILEIQAALKAAAPKEQIDALLGKATAAQSASFKERFLGALRSAGLPFEAFSEGVNALVGPAVPQDKFQERSARSRKLLKSMFTGELSVADAAGALREVYEERSGWEQFITGFAFDPTNLLIPGAVGIRTAIKTATRAGAQAGVQAGARGAARSFINWMLPVGGNKVADHMGLGATKRLMTEATGTGAKESEAWMARERRRASRVGGGSGDDTPDVSDIASASQEAKLSLKWFYNALKSTPEEGVSGLEQIAKDRPAVDALVRFYRTGMASANPAQKALLQLGIESWGRAYEIGNLRLKDINFEYGFVRLRSLERGAGEARISVPLSDEAVDLLEELALSKVPDKAAWATSDIPLFTVGDVLGTRATKATETLSADILASTGVNAYLATVAKAAGLPESTSPISLRVMLGSALGEVAYYGGASLNFVRTYLGHGDLQAWATYMREAGMSLQVDVSSAARYVSGTGNDVKYVPIVPGAGEAAARAAVLGEEAAQLRAEIRKVPELRGVKLRQFKGKGGTKPILSQKRTAEGKALLEALPLDDYAWLASGLSGLSNDDKAILLIALRTAEGMAVLHDLEVVREHASVMAHATAGIGKTKTTAQAAWQGVMRGANSDFRTLLAGLGGYNQLTSGLRDDLHRIWNDLETRGVVGKDVTSRIEQIIDDSELLVTAKAEATKGFHPSGGIMRKEELEKIGLSYDALQDKPGLAFIELAADEASRQARIREWLANPNIRQVLGRYGIAIGVDATNRIRITEQWTTLRAKLLRIATRGSAAAHILGNDLHTPPSSPLPGHLRANAEMLAERFGEAYTGKGPDEVARARRVEAIMQGLPPDILLELERQHVKTKETLAVARGKREHVPFSDEEIEAQLAGAGAPPRAPRASQQKPDEPGRQPYLPGTDKVERERWVKDLRGDTFSWEEAERYDIRASEWVSEQVEGSEQVISDVSKQTGVGAALRHTKATTWRNLLQFVALPSASFRGREVVGGGPPTLAHFGRLTAVWRSLRLKNSGDLSRMMAKIDSLPVYKSIRAMYIDPNEVSPHFASWLDTKGGLELADGALSTDEWRDLVKLAQGFTGEFKGRIRVQAPHLKTFAEKTAWNQLFNPDLMFGGLGIKGKQIPLERLPALYKLTPEQIEFIGRIREVPRQATLEAIRDVGLPTLKEFMGGVPQLTYFPRNATRLLAEKQRVAPLEARPMGTPGSWAKERKVADVSDAWRTETEYGSPVDSAFLYSADLRQLAVDKRFKQAGLDGGYYDKSKTQWVDQEKASRTLLTLAEAIKGGELPDVASQRISSLLGYADSRYLKSDIVHQLGLRATELLEHPEKVDEYMPSILRDVHRAEEAMQSTLGLHQMTKEIPGLESMYFKDDITARRAVQYLKEQEKGLHRVLSGLNKTSSALRMMTAGLDFSWVTIQGLILLPYRPWAGAESGAAIWGRSVHAAWKVMGDPRYTDAVFARDSDIIREMISSTVVWNTQHELTEAAPILSDIWGAVGSGVGGALGSPFRKAEKGAAAGAWLKNIPEGAERMFTTYLLMARLQSWKAMRHMARDASGKMNPDKLRELAGAVNKMTGVYNPATTGVSQFQRHMEGTFLSFAAMYRRAAYGLVVDAFRGVPGVTPRLDTKIAQQALLDLIAAGLTMAFLAKESGNNPEALDPGSAKFMTFKAGGNYIGLGSAYYALARSAYAVTEQALDPERRSQLATLDVRDNQLLRWWRSQAPPIPQGGLELVLGQTYIGEPLRGADGGITQSIIPWAINQVTPMAWDTLWSQVRGPGDTPVVVGESYGLRTFPVSLQEKRRQLANNLLLMDEDPDIVAWRRKQASAGNPVIFAQLPVLLQGRLERNHLDLQEARAEVEADTLRRGRSQQQRVTQYFQQIRKNKDFINSEMQKAVASYQEVGDPRKFRDKIGELETAGWALAERSGQEFGDVTKFLDEQKAVRASTASAFLGDLIYDRYYTNVVFNPLTKDKNGNFLPHVREALDDKFRQEQGSDWWDYVQKRRKESKDRPDLVREYYDAIDDLQPYWKLHYSLWGDYSANSRAIDNYNEMSPRDREAAKAASPRLRRLLSTLEAAKLKFRDQNPELDWLLVRWYGNQPRTALARQRLVGNY